MKLSRLVFSLSLLAVILACAAPSSVGDELAGSQGTNTALPATDSAVTLSGRDQFSDLKITVNQTKSLNNQAVSVTWTGGRPTLSDSKFFEANYLQIMQCWGNDDGTVPTNPGPPPEQCVFGATYAVYGEPDQSISQWGFSSQRALSNKNWPGYDPSQGALDPSSGVVWKPFRGVSGDVTNVPLNQNFDPQLGGGAYWLNPDFDAIKTNEIAAARTGSNGTGAELFRVDTGQESNGLGCGQNVQPVAGGGFTTPKCWLVIVPRGTGSEEDVGALTGTASSSDVVTSPLAPNAWKNRIAVPLQFNPLQSPCSLAADQRQMSGNELAQTAISSWQPALCTGGAHGPYSYSVVNDSVARLQLQSNTPGGAGLIAVAKPFDPSAFLSTNPVVYAPLTLSATVIGFNVERHPKQDADAAVQALAGVRVADMNLTPRLLSKLLTQSYYTEVEIYSTVPPGYTWLKANPSDITKDPDFLQFNPEFSTLNLIQPRDTGGLILPLGNSDQAEQVWQYILADPEAKSWLDGNPDPWGMRVNPVYATQASANSTGQAFADPAPNFFPKSDPYCYQAPDLTTTPVKVTPPPICGSGWLPYSANLHAAARTARSAADGSKLVENTFAPSPDQVWSADLPQQYTTRAMLSLTDSPSAALFGLQMAKLSRAGDDGSGRRFIAPDSTGLTSAVGTMKAKTVPGVLEPDPSAASTTAYPLATLTYGVSAPLQLDSKSRQDFGYLLDYAAGAGQTPGYAPGQLPAGYAPLPVTLRTQLSAAAQLVRTLSLPNAPSPTTPRTAVSGRTTTNASGSGGPTVSSPGGATSVVPSGGLPSASGTIQAPTPPTKPKVLLTPAMRAVSSRYFVPALVVVCLLAALGAMEITKRPRQGSAVHPTVGDGRDDSLTSIDWPGGAGQQ